MAQRKDFRRIGLLVPSSSSVQERDIGRALPEDITLHVARMRLSNVDAESTLRIVQEIETESQKLADVDVDVIIFPATAPSSRNGIGYDQELIKRITAASGKPATTASTALLEALHVLSVKQIALGAPWSASVNQGRPRRGCRHGAGMPPWRIRHRAGRHRRWRIRTVRTRRAGETPGTGAVPAGSPAGST